MFLGLLWKCQFHFNINKSRVGCDASIITFTFVLFITFELFSTAHHIMEQTVATFMMVHLQT